MSACDNFVENLWRKGKCANCFQSRERHQHEDKIQGDNSKANSGRVLIHLHDQEGSHSPTAPNIEQAVNSVKRKDVKGERSRQGGTNGIKIIVPCAPTKTDNNRSCSDSIRRHTSKTDETPQLFVVNKPKPVPRSKPRPPSRVVDGGNGLLSLQQSSDAQSDSIQPHKDSLGKSLSNANSLKSVEPDTSVLSVPGHDTKEIQVLKEATNSSDIETVRETIEKEEAVTDIQVSTDLDLTGLDEGSEKILSNNAALVDSGNCEKDLSELTFIDNDDSDGDGYVPMKSNVALFTAEPIRFNSMRKTDVKMEANYEVGHHSYEQDISDEEKTKATNASDSEAHEERRNSSGVLEFRNPLCLISSKTRSKSVNSNSSEGSGGTCDKLTPDRITSEASSANPSYVNRPASTTSTDTGSSSHDSGYENTRKSTRSNSSNSCLDEVAPGVTGIVNTGNANSADLTRMSQTKGDFVIESSGASCSSWGSSTWDSCSASDFQENSCESVRVEKAAGRLDVSKPDSVVITTQPKSEQMTEADKGSVNASHTYVNATLKPFTKPYKVVDISSGVSVPTAKGQSDVPPLPPKEKDLKKERPGELKSHVYLEPSGERQGIPEQGPPDERKDVINNPRESTCSSPPLNAAPNTTMDKSGVVRRAPAPRPRSRVPSQFGTLPKPAPRASRTPGDVSKLDNKEVKELNVATSQPVVPITPLTSTPSSSPSPPSLQRLPSLKNSKKATNPTSPPVPKKGTLDPGSSDKPSESVPLSPVNNDGIGVGETQEGPMKPKRCAPPPPLSASSPPPPKSPVSRSVTEATVKPVSPSPSNAKPTRSSSFSDAHGSNVSSPPPKVQPSPKSTLRRAFASMRKLGGKRKNRHSKTIEISGPIISSDEMPGIFTYKEAVPQQAPPEEKSADVDHTSTLDAERPESPVIKVAVRPVMSSSAADPSSPLNTLQSDGRSSGASSPVMQTEPGIGYQNFPLSKGGDTLEKPKKPPRVAKVVKPLQHSELSPDGEAVMKKYYDDEQTYLQPNQDELTLKVETALANLNDAEILAEALSRVEQEKLGPLPAIPRSRQVRFRCDDSNASNTSPETKAELRRPVRVVSPTLINGSGDKGDFKSRPKLPSRPPNTKPAGNTIRERSHSFESRSLERHKPTVARSRSLSSASGLEKRYNKILKLQLQTLEDMIHSWRDELLPDVGVDLWDTRWSDYEAHGNALEVRSPGAILLPVKCAMFWEGNRKLLAKVEYPIPASSYASQRSPFKHDMRVCESLPHHVNVSRVLTHFTDNVSGDVIEEAECDSYETTVSITDQIPCETVADFVKRNKEEHENDPEAYEKKVCLLLLQLLSAIDHLHKETVVHRDLKMENMFLTDCGLLFVANFQHALQQAKDSRPSPFILRKNASSDLGGNWEHLPPEILNAPEETDLLNYENCDNFAAGCLMYELLHRPNPFRVNPLLVQQDYDQTDLPPVPTKSRFSWGLGRIARQLLRRYPQERLSAGEALQMFQVLLWGPKELDDDSIEVGVSEWLETERAHTVAMIARNQMQKSYSQVDFVETYMKCQFLVDASADSLSYMYQLLELDKERGKNYLALA